MVDQMRLAQCASVASIPSAEHAVDRTFHDSSLTRSHIEANAAEQLKAVTMEEGTEEEYSACPMSNMRTTVFHQVKFVLVWQL